VPNAVDVQLRGLLSHVIHELLVQDLKPLGVREGHSKELEDALPEASRWALLHDDLGCQHLVCCEGYSALDPLKIRREDAQPIWHIGVHRLLDCLEYLKP